MDAGRELDALVAEKIFGLVPCQGEHRDYTPWCYADPSTPWHGGELPAYSDDIAAAWQVVEQMVKDGWDWSAFYYDGAYYCRFKKDKDTDFSDIGYTMPVSTCLAALSAVGAR